MKIYFIIYIHQTNFAKTYIFVYFQIGIALEKLSEVMKKAEFESISVRAEFLLKIQMANDHFR